MKHYEKGTIILYHDNPLDMYVILDFGPFDLTVREVSSKEGCYYSDIRLFTIMDTVLNDL